MSRDLQSNTFSAYRPAFLLGGMVPSSSFRTSAPDVEQWSEDRIDTRWVESRASQHKAAMVRTLFKRVFARS
ncbi:MAG: hypothetical protein LAT62_10245 [Natronospirillum sp.]|uniref:hypothetical protein n=1 Tax=Natronospirillum sp. TaxID=2812955 RepID=UPI0025D57DB5|nr:hypothetical protein [Natronospirillum sp.]MCH8552307.1 hypothetical protein [Natronospirillum sp.]